LIVVNLFKASLSYGAGDALKRTECTAIWIIWP